MTTTNSTGVVSAKPDADEVDVGLDHLLKVALERHLDRAVCAIESMISRLEAGDTTLGAGEVTKAIQDYRKAHTTAFEERKRYDELRAKFAGGAARGVLDMGAARAAIVDRLARLRAAAGAG
ncbi:hypothetical protein [Aquimixticola soesokkakensis]|uniref:hypothetical protein n=1 Tax=Aquimixticola soesokkakensis TaxID=1519096 RepID=UPI001F19E3F9|nr:hypothetical protein [Aquimixticola soesokkakensis]